MINVHEFLQKLAHLLPPTQPVSLPATPDFSSMVHLAAVFHGRVVQAASTAPSWTGGHEDEDEEEPDHDGGQGDEDGDDETRQGHAPVGGAAVTRRDQADDAQDDARDRGGPPGDDPGQPQGQ